MEEFGHAGRCGKLTSLQTGSADSDGLAGDDGGDGLTSCGVGVRALRNRFHATFRRNEFMALSTLPLSYCTNLHPGLTVETVRNGLHEFTIPARQRFGSLAAGLWLARPVITELLQTPRLLEELRDDLRQGQLSCYTLNTFPYGNFHDVRVKENVYLPDWTSPARLDFTKESARVLAALMDDDITEGSMSTVPLGFKPLVAQQGDIGTFLDRCADQLIELARFLAKLEQQTGKRIRLAIEPEPFCVIETTPEAIAFFERLNQRAVSAGAAAEVSEYLGLCYDVCHQSVEFEDVAESIQQLVSANVRINKVHITCAIRLENPATNADGRATLARYVEPRYLHQTIARAADGTLVRDVDLNAELVNSPSAAFANASEWRVHFHVPVNAERLGSLRTTRDDLRRALATVKELSYAPHLEVETYTWEVLPDGRRVNLIDGLTTELTATRDLLTSL